jgi:hypothetical protein
MTDSLTQQLTITIRWHIGCVISILDNNFDLTR